MASAEFPHRAFVDTSDGSYTIYVDAPNKRAAKRKALQQFRPEQQAEVTSVTYDGPSTY